MYARPTNVVDVYRGSIADDTYPGQENDDNDLPPVLTNVLIAITEGPVNSGDTSQHDETTERSYAAKVRSNADIRKGDRLQDNKTQMQYVVEAVIPRTSPFGKADKELSLTRME